MRKLILTAMIAAAALPATSAMAQSAGELRRDRQDIREQQRDLRDARRYGDRRDVREQRRDVREARQEYREDWRDYRRAHGDVFRGPAYVAPVRGWSYRPIAVGYAMPRSFYHQRYWIADPFRYRLPAAGPSTRWVRYGRDVALVNIRTGRVITVYNSFFY